MGNYITIVLTLCALIDFHPNSSNDFQTSKEKIDSTFHFTFESGDDFIESKTGKLTRLYKDGNKTVVSKFTDLDIKLIDSIYYKYKLDTLPDIYNPYYNSNCQLIIVPTFDTELVIYTKGKIKRITYNSDYHCEEGKTKQIEKKIGMLVNAIAGILMTKEEFLDMENSDIVHY